MSNVTQATNNAGPRRLPFAFAKQHGVMFGGVEDHGIEVIYHGTPSQAAMTEIQRCAGQPIRLHQVSEAEFDAYLQSDYEHRAAESTQIAAGLGEDIGLSDAAQALGQPQELLESDDDAPIIRLINALLTEAVKEEASDIHIEPFESRLTVRFRVDGVLREVLNPPRAIAPRLISRVKVMARLDIAERRVPQDGRISVRIAGRPVDIRVSTIPSGTGERVVLRLLDKQAGKLDLSQLGMPDSIQSKMDALLHQPHGMVIVTGPTGSGKTTTLYAGVGRINDHSRNIMTIEDPIEYYIDGIAQTQVNPKVGMDFASGFRAILRQDPDVVMVGEIRDSETANIATQSALTGHLVLSTLHTNNAVGAVTRLYDMGIEPFLTASSLSGVLAQRLVRTLCTNCRQPYQPNETEQAKAQVGAAAHLYKPAGCDECNHSGYRGRTGIYELVIVDDAMRGLIHQQASEQALTEQARKHTASILDDGMALVRKGVTTIEEVLRVTRDSEPVEVSA